MTSSFQADRKIEVSYKKLAADAIIWTRGTSESAGYDIFSYEDVIIPIHEQQLISTKIAIAIPAGWYGQIMSRSGLAVKSQLATKAGVIDADFCGEVKVLIRNEGSGDSVLLRKGDKIAQMVFLPCGSANFTEVSELPSTQRGAGGFGSTGK